MAANNAQWQPTQPGTVVAHQVLSGGMAHVVPVTMQPEDPLPPGMDPLYHTQFINVSRRESILPCFYEDN